MGRKENLKIAKDSCSRAINALADIKAQDLKSRKSVKNRLKHKYSLNIDMLSLTIDYLKEAKREIRVMPKAVQ